MHIFTVNISQTVTDMVNIGIAKIQKVAKIRNVNISETEQTQKCYMTLNTKYFNSIFFSKMQITMKVFLQICLNLYGTGRRVLEGAELNEV